MDRWESKPQPRHRRNNPSFSSSLLDAIYRSIDESDLNLTGGAPDPTPKNHGTAPSLAVTRLNYSSDSSSSSYSADSARIIRPKPVRTAPIQTRPDRIQVDPQPPPQKQKKQLRDHLRKSTSSSPSSPGAKLALFLNSLFSASSHKKPKISTDDSSPSPSPPISTSSASRSCLSKTPSTRRSDGSARSVRFVIDGELTAARDRERRRMMVEELLKGIEMEMEQEEEESDDDLFELENLAGIVSDELPVYETTDVGINSAIAKGLVV